uniref:Uncharacterized protein n=1 Tax=Noccaea caerulescens TaxID=107243 RepID=A0A1J3JMN9_NOCCA
MRNYAKVMYAMTLNLFFEIIKRTTLNLTHLLDSDSAIETRLKNGLTPLTREEIRIRSNPRSLCLGSKKTTEQSSYRRDGRISSDRPESEILQVVASKHRLEIGSPLSSCKILSSSFPHPF